jgi:hypothetical protein
MPLLTRIKISDAAHFLYELNRQTGKSTFKINTHNVGGIPRLIEYTISALSYVNNIMNDTCIILYKANVDYLMHDIMPTLLLGAKDISINPDEQNDRARICIITFFAMSLMQQPFRTQDTLYVAGKYLTVAEMLPQMPFYAVADMEGNTKIQQCGFIMRILGDRLADRMQDFRLRFLGRIADEPVGTAIDVGEVFEMITANAIAVNSVLKGGSGKVYSDVFPFLKGTLAANTPIAQMFPSSDIFMLPKITKDDSTKSLEEITMETITTAKTAPLSQRSQILDSLDAQKVYKMGAKSASEDIYTINHDPKQRITIGWECKAGNQAVTFGMVQKQINKFGKSSYHAVLVMVAMNVGPEIAKFIPTDTNALVLKEGTYHAIEENPLGLLYCNPDGEPKGLLLDGGHFRGLKVSASRQLRGAGGWFTYNEKNYEVKERWASDNGVPHGTVKLARRMFKHQEVNHVVNIPPGMNVVILDKPALRDFIGNGNLNDMETLTSNVNDRQKRVRAISSIMSQGLGTGSGASGELSGNFTCFTLFYTFLHVSGFDAFTREKVEKIKRGTQATIARIVAELKKKE